jgi:hypothetical protein
MSAPSSGGDRLVPTPDIRAAIKGHEADLLDALSVRWREGGRHRREKRQKGRGDVIPPDQHGDGATPRASCTLVAYAVAKRLPIEFLREIGLSEISYQRAPAVRIPEAVR